jgi:hypothetical protein
VLSRRAARLVTGPLAFLAAGAVDVTLLWGQWAGRTLAARLRRLAR